MQRTTTACVRFAIKPFLPPVLVGTCNSMLLPTFTHHLFFQILWDMSKSLYNSIHNIRTRSHSRAFHPGHRLKRPPNTAQEQKASPAEVLDLNAHGRAELARPIIGVIESGEAEIPTSALGKAQRPSYSKHQTGNPSPIRTGPTVPLQQA